MQKDISWAIGGEAGFGIMAAGTMLAKAFSRTGYRTIAINEYPSLIRGGHNFVDVRIATKEIFSPKKHIDLLVALHKQAVELHKEDISSKSVVLFDPKDYEWKKEEFTDSPTLIPIPLADIVKKFGGNPIVRNTVALGASMALLGKDLSFLSVVIKDQFFKKGQAVVDENTEIAQAGFDFIKEMYPSIQSLYIDEPEQKNPHLVMNASEAVGLGAVAGGMKFAAIYPMTPINGLIQLFADHEKEFDIIYKQPEDEIAGINMAIGASLAGARSMVATSGGGFALMVEAVSMTGIMEVPLVVDLGMRPGPATGMPTWTEQGELQMVIRAGHGDFSRIVLAPGDIDECFTLTQQAFHLADQFQIPVFLLTDKYLNETQWQISQNFLEKVQEMKTSLVEASKISSDFKRYNLQTDDGVSKRSLPGMKNGQYLANSYEHDEFGWTTEDAIARKAMVDKRAKKLQKIQQEALSPVILGEENADITFVSFGSLKGVIRESLMMLQQKQIKGKLIHFPWVYPLPNGIETLFEKEKRIVCVEQNSTGQLAQLIHATTGREIKELWLKYDGRQWKPEEIVEKVMSSK